MEDKGISQAVIARLPRYYRYLGELSDEGVERISSGELSDLMHVTASQIRQDFNHFGGFGQQGYGYNVSYLYQQIGTILGMDQTHRLVIVGAGNLGCALAKYGNFERRGFLIEGLFDQNEKLIGKKVRGIEIRPMEELEAFVKDHKIDIGVLTIPKTEAVAVSKRLVTGGVKGIWNFAHVDLDLPKDVKVENVHLSDSLMRLAYAMQ